MSARFLVPLCCPCLVGIGGKNFVDCFVSLNPCREWFWRLSWNQQAVESLISHKNNISPPTSSMLLLCFCCAHKFSFTYRWTFLFDKIRELDILINSIFKSINAARKDIFAILNGNLRPLNWTLIRKTTWKWSVLGFLVLRKLLVTKSIWQNKTFLDHWETVDRA